MTVKILTPAQKAAVVTIFTSKIRPKIITEIAGFLGVSTRTVGRVLTEAGISSERQESTEAKKVMALLYKHKINAAQLEILMVRVPADTVQLLVQTVRTRKSPAGHTGKQILLPLPLKLPDLELRP